MINTQFSPWPSYTKEELNAVSSILISNKVNYWTGKEGREFEKEFSAWSNTKYAIALANGTLALDIAFNALGLSSGDEVIVTSRSYIASVSSIVNAGATPIFADVDLNTQNLSPISILSKITKNTKAILCVHLAGWPCEMDEIMTIAKEYQLFVIEDCAQAHGAKYKGKPVGSIGDIGCWSFCQDKIMSTGGEGGMVTTNSELFWKHMWSFKDHGKDYSSVDKKDYSEGFRFVHNSFGSNYRMTEIQAAIGRIQLKRMNSWHKKRVSNAKKIWDKAREYKCLRVPNIPDGIEHGAYKCYVFVTPSRLNDGWSRDRIIKEINAFGVPCYSGACSEVYLERAFDKTNFRPAKRLKVAKELGETSLMFLVHPTLTGEEIKKTRDIISNIMKIASL